MFADNVAESAVVAGSVGFAAAVSVVVAAMGAAAGDGVSVMGESTALAFCSLGEDGGCDTVVAAVALDEVESAPLCSSDSLGAGVGEEPSVS